MVVVFTIDRSVSFVGDDLNVRNMAKRLEMECKAMGNCMIVRDWELSHADIPDRDLSLAEGVKSSLSLNFLMRLQETVL